MRNKIRLFVWLTALIIGVSGCSETQTDKVVEYADNLQDAIDQFEDSKKRLPMMLMR